MAFGYESEKFYNEAYSRNVSRNAGQADNQQNFEDLLLFKRFKMLLKAEVSRLEKLDSWS